jgi:hypothetical protein
MRYLFGFLFVLALVASAPRVSAQTSEERGTHAGLGVDAISHAPPQLMLRASYFYDVGADPLGGPPHASGPTPWVGFALALAWVSSPLSVGAQPVEEDSLSSWQSEEPTTVTEEGQPRKRLSKRARIAIGVTVPIVVVGVAVGAGLGAAVSNSWSSSSSQ